jgi:predicted alpha/beta superfamily hydrolase
MSGRIKQTYGQPGVRVREHNPLEPLAQKPLDPAISAKFDRQMTLISRKSIRIARSWAMMLPLALSACGGGGVSDGGVSGGGGAVNDSTQIYPSPDESLTQISCSAHIYCREITNYPAISNARPGTRESLVPIASGYTGRTYELSVYVPATYGESTDPFPVIYSLDGDRLFQERADEIEHQQKDVILVSIHADSSRNTDYLYYEGDGAAQSGQDFYNYIVFELIPFVEASFRIDPNRRALEGHSHGGTFVVYSLFIDRLNAQYFRTFAAEGPSIWIHEASLNDLETRLSQRFSGLDIDVYLSSGLPGDPTESNGDVTEALYDYFVSAGFQDLDIQYYSYDLNHSGMHRPAFADFLHDHY